eukprot:m.52298 g.52298  ORF g.52298 m.52298 type:complete len:264 (+) comp13057_c0_seq2:37-828(+)
MYRDVVAAKEQLDFALGEHQVEDYWADFKLFAAGKLDKSTWDQRATARLGNNVEIHNNFIRALVQSARTEPVAPADPPSSTPAAAAAAAAGQNSDKKKRKTVFREVGFDRFGTPVENPPQPTLSLLQATQRAQQAFDDLPSIPVLHAMTYIAAVDARLKDVNQEAVALMSEALDAYLTTLLEECVVGRSDYLARGPLLYALRPTPTTTTSTTSTSQTSPPPPPLGLHDLRKVVALRPRLLGPSLLTARERLLAHEQSVDDLYV